MSVISTYLVMLIGAFVTASVIYFGLKTVKLI